MQHAFHRYHFRGQRENERILRIIHRHWFNLFSHLLLILVFSVLLIASLFIAPLVFPEILDARNARFFVFVENTFFIFVWLFGFLLWIDYYFDVWIITSERIVNIEQKGLFVRHISELNFFRVQDVTATVEGLLPTVLNYGDVEVQTAGEENRFIFRQVPDPYHIKDMVMELSRHKTSIDQREAVVDISPSDDSLI
ncbi:MAG: PH domain-containing protein [Candidatus Moraniibacteriota bacterium]